MVARAIRLAVIAVLFCSLGGHLAILQTVAWTKMAFHFSQTCSLGSSLQKTFDGRHLCPLCLKIKKISQTGPSLGAFRTENRMDAACLASAPRLGKIDRVFALRSHALDGNDRHGTPDSPPPKEPLS